MSGRKKEPKPKLFGPDIFGRGGGLPREGVGAKKFRYAPRNQGNQTFLAGYPGILPGYPGSARKVCLVRDSRVRTHVCKKGDFDHFLEIVETV